MALFYHILQQRSFYLKHSFFKFSEAFSQLYHHGFFSSWWLIERIKPALSSSENPILDLLRYIGFNEHLEKNPIFLYNTDIK